MHIFSLSVSICVQCFANHKPYKPLFFDKFDIYFSPPYPLLKTYLQIPCSIELSSGRWSILVQFQTMLFIQVFLQTILSRETTPTFVTTVWLLNKMTQYVSTEIARVFYRYTTDRTLVSVLRVFSK